MILDSSQGALGCVVTHLGSPLSSERHDEAAFYAARRLRKLYPNSKALWATTKWDLEVDRILEVIQSEFDLCCTERRSSTFCQTTGFIPWRLFRYRSPVAIRGGVYLLAVYDSPPPNAVEPLGKEVIYVGKAGGRDSTNSILQRLCSFELTALGGMGHSAGWTYRNEFVSDWESLQSFRNLYTSWNEFGVADQRDARTEEKQILIDYLKQWGRLPILNKKL